MSACPSYTTELYHLGGTSGFEIRAGTRWSPHPQTAGYMEPDPQGHYVNNLVLMEANRRINALHGAKAKLTNRVRALEEEVGELQRTAAVQPLMAQAVYARLKVDPHAADLFEFVRSLAILMQTDTN